MIAVKLEGRMGNQLFQYAFIYAASKKLNTPFYLDKSIDDLLIDKYFTIENDFCHGLDSHVFSIQGFKNLFSFYLRKGFYSLLGTVLLLRPETFSNHESPKAQLYKIQNNRVYLGNFQSEEYFSTYKVILKACFL